MNDHWGIFCNRRNQICKFIDSVSERYTFVSVIANAVKQIEDSTKLIQTMVFWTASFLAVTQSDHKTQQLND
jgi:hypothetical protein